MDNITGQKRPHRKFMNSDIEEPILNIQAHICHWCHNDHSNDRCDTKDVMIRIERMEDRVKVLTEALELIRANQRHTPHGLIASKALEAR